MAGAIPAQASAARDRRGSSIAARRGRRVEFDLSDCGKLPKIRAAKTAFCVMAVSGPHVTFCLAKVRSHKRINWFLTGLAGRWKLHRRRHPARKSSSIAAKMARGSPSTFAASLNVEHAPQRRPCFQLKIAGRLLLDVTNTDFRTAPSRTPASLRSLGPVLRIANFVKWAPV